MIPPRGCAYVVMDRRQDGYKALTRLRNVKLQGSTIKVWLIDYYSSSVKKMLFTIVSNIVL